MKFLEKFGSYSVFMIIIVVLAWFALFFLSPLASSVEMANNWDWWLHRVATNWKLVILGCIVFSAFVAVIEIKEEEEEKR